MARDPVQFTVSIERAINLWNYKSLRVCPAESFGAGAVTLYDAYDGTRWYVEWMIWPQIQFRFQLRQAVLL